MRHGADCPRRHRTGSSIGLAGTVSTLACLDRGITVYDRDRSTSPCFTRDDVERWLDILAAEDALARLARPGMTEGTRGRDRRRRSRPRRRDGVLRPRPVPASRRTTSSTVWRWACCLRRATYPRNECRDITAVEFPDGAVHELVRPYLPGDLEQRIVGLVVEAACSRRSGVPVDRPPRRSRSDSGSLYGLTMTSRVPADIAISADSGSPVTHGSRSPVASHGFDSSIGIRPSCCSTLEVLRHAFTDHGVSPHDAA